MDLPVTGDVEVEVADVRCVFRDDDVASELTRSEPEREVWNFVELELRVDPAGVRRMSLQSRKVLWSRRLSL